MAHSISVLCLFLALGAPFAAQETPAAAPRPASENASTVVGSVAGKPITEHEFALELAARYRDHELGRSLIEDFRSRLLVEKAARNLGVSVTSADLDAEYRAIDERVKKETQGKQSLDQVLAQKHTNRAEFQSYLRRLVTVRKIIRVEQKLGVDAEVSDDAVRDWLAARAKTATVVTDPSALPPEVVMTVDEAHLSQAQFGAEILATLDLKDRARELNRTLNERVVASALTAQGLAMTEADLDAAIERERMRYAENPQTRNIAYAAILKQLGTTIEKRKQDPNFRANVALRKITEALYTDQQLESYYAENQDRLGPTVRVRHIFVRVKDPANPFSSGASEEEARQRIEALRRKVVEGGEEFQKVARAKSEDRSRFNGGDVGFIHRRGRYDPTFSEAAFALEGDAVSAPVRTRAGFHLLKVIEKRPAPAFAETRDSVLRARARDWFQETIRAAALRNVYVEQLKAGRKPSAESATKEEASTAPKAPVKDAKTR